MEELTFSYFTRSLLCQVSYKIYWPMQHAQNPLQLNPYPANVENMVSS